MTLRCPRCSSALHLAKRHTLAIGPCYECGGLWLSSDASRTVEAAMDAQASHAATSAEVGARAPRPERLTGGPALSCPECRAQMKRWPVAVVEVDRCQEHGTFYDRGELQEVQRHLITQRSPIGAPKNYAVEDSGLELARDPRQQLDVVYGMVLAEARIANHNKRTDSREDFLELARDGRFEQCERWDFD